MKVLVVGSGAREHALVSALLSDPAVTEVVAAPGNAGIAADVLTVPLDVTDPAAVAALAQELAVDLVVVGPEVPLVAGAADAVRAAGIACFGPSKAAAQLEGSKAFAKQVMAEAGVPTAMAHVCTSVDEVAQALDQFGSPYVVKDDGLAAGKGVVVTSDRDEAMAHARTCLSHGNDAQVVVEEYLDGPEVSLFGITDGTTVVPLQPAQDFKRVGEGDEGPNTGGMGAYSPAPVVTRDIHERVMREVINPTLQGMAADGLPYTGFLYAGLMIAPDGAVKVLEYNCRFGDPETQPIMMRLKSDLVALCEAALAGELDKADSDWDERAALGVVLAASGYPDAYLKGAIISGLPTEDVEDSKVFHAGTAQVGDDIVTAGGRVLCACALGNDIKEAQAKAYDLAGKIAWNGVYYRTDIGFKAI